MRVEKNPKHLHIEFIVSSHNSVTSFPKMVTPHIGVPLKPKICSSAARFDLRNINETGIKYLNWTSKMILSQHNCCCCNKDRWWSFWHFARKTVFGCLLRAARHTKLCLISLSNILLIVLLVVRIEIDSITDKPYVQHKCSFQWICSASGFRKKSKVVFQFFDCVWLNGLLWS